MANIIKKILTANFLLALGLLLLFLPQAEFVGGWFTFLSPYQSIGALLVGFSALWTLYMTLKK